MYALAGRATQRRLWQLSQPSHFVAFASSHSSVPLTMPSPHAGGGKTHAPLMHEVAPMHAFPHDPQFALSLCVLAQ
jgi:hypothetical protein